MTPMCYYHYSKPTESTSTTSVPSTSNNNGTRTKSIDLSGDDEMFEGITDEFEKLDELEKQQRESANLVSMKTNQTSLGEVPEKRNHKSLIDCLDRSYTEKPSKIKRESTPQPWLGEYDQIIDNLKKPTTQNEEDSQKGDQFGDEIVQSLEVLKESINQQNDSKVAEKSNDSKENDKNRMDTDDGEDSSNKSPNDKSQKKIQQFFKTVPKKLASDETETK